MGCEKLSSGEERAEEMGMAVGAIGVGVCGVSWDMHGPD